MAKGSGHRKEDKKKPRLTLKERRAKKHDKKLHKQEHRVDEVVHFFDDNTI